MSQPVTTPPDAHEAELLKRARAGDRSAMGDLLTAHQDRVFNVCLRMLGRRDDAAEATQDVLLRVIEKLHTFRGDCALSTWITRLAINQSFTLLRRRVPREAAVNHHPDGQAGGAGWENHADGREQNPASRVQTGEMVELLRRAIARLDEPMRAVLVLRDIEQLSYDRIAEVLEIEVGTVKSRLFRARLALRQAMTPPPPEVPPGVPPGVSPEVSPATRNPRPETA